MSKNLIDNNEQPMITIVWRAYDEEFGETVDFFCNLTKADVSCFLDIIKSRAKTRKLKPYAESMFLWDLKAAPLGSFFDRIENSDIVIEKTDIFSYMEDIHIDADIDNVFDYYETGSENMMYTDGEYIWMSCRLHGNKEITDSEKFDVCEFKQTAQAKLINKFRSGTSE